MPEYTLRWANRSHSDQDWMISTGDNFHLRPDYVRTVHINIVRDYTFRIAVSTDGRMAAADLTYTAHTATWTLDSHTPNEWQLVVGNNIVTVRCRLEDAGNDDDHKKPDYLAGLPEYEEGALDKGYPAYQLYRDNTGTTYCSKTKVSGHDVGKQWIRKCLKAHPGTSCHGKPWISPNQSGTVWP